MSNRVLLWLVVVIALTGCTHRPGVFEGEVTLSNGHVLSNAGTYLFNEGGERTVVFEYETNLGDFTCAELRQEVREAWSEYLRAEADRLEATDAQVAPKNQSGVSVGFLLRRNSSGAWDELNFAICG